MTESSSSSPLLTFSGRSGVRVDLDRLVASRALIQANSGGGKSWALRYLLEQTHGRIQQIVIDPEGEFASLREKFDYLLAAKDGDVPAEPKSAKLLARRIVELGVSAVVDIYELPLEKRTCTARSAGRASPNRIPSKLTRADRLPVQRTRRRDEAALSGRAELMGRHRPKLSKKTKARVFERCGNRCLRCGRGEPEVFLEIDHIVPRSKGGTSDESNLQALCVDCNKLKLDHLPGESAEAIIYRWCEEVFGPLACNASLRPRLARRLVRRLAIVQDFSSLLDAADSDDQA